MVSHELRTPLSAILGWAQMLHRPDLDPESYAEGLETIDRNAKLQARIIEDLLDVSRIIAGNVRLDARPVELGPVIEAAMDLLRPAADDKDIRIQATLDPQAGPVSGDPSRLQQIVWNILSNAVKFTPRAGRVQVRLERVNSHAEITVSDTGIGIEPEFLPFVFDRFRQADSGLTRSHTGLGLGLAIVRNLVELHGGAVRAESPGKNRGATFTVKLPRVTFDEAERMAAKDRKLGHPSAEEEAPLEYPPASLEGVKVLVVDDEPDARELLTAVLGGDKAEVIAVASAAEALSTLDDFKPDVVVSDVEMPGEDGYSMIRKVRAMEAERGRKIPAAALTAHASLQDRMQALASGFQMHIPKPVEPAELVAAVASLAGRTASH
jgi:CheY-like chemotaxis protein